ncbi:MAG: acyl carrier protein [Roseobacter sp.]
MTNDPIQTVILKQLYAIAPDIDINDINPSADLRDEFDIDSMDFLNLITALGKRYDLQMPEADYEQMRSLTDLVKYLQEKVAEAS